MKKHGYLSLLSLLTPFLLANSPSPYPSPDIYYQFTYTSLQIETIADDVYSYSTVITNTGEGYIDLSSFLFQSTIHDDDYVYVYLDVFQDEFLMPDGVFFLTFNHEEYREDLSLPFLYAYEIDREGITVTAIEDVYRDLNSEHDAIHVNVSYSAPFDAYYLALIVLTVDDQPLVISSTSLDKNSLRFSHSSLASIDMSRIEIQSVLLVRGRQHHDQSMNYMFYILGLGAILTMFISGLFLAAFVFGMIWLVKKILK
jgi:hypothetical protein